jgi:PTH1 family peptidyl-tRNA hydrolase
MFKRLLKKDDGALPYLIVGLGNPGPEYKDNRHNVGFMVLDKLAEQLGEAFGRVQSEALVASARHGAEKLVLAKPRTFMNNSGRAVGALARFYKPTPERILVVYDEVDLPFESLRIRPSGGAAGHKGMRSIIQHLGTQAFPRLRIGIGRPKGRMPTPNHVLQDFSRQEREALPFVLGRAVDAALCFLDEGVDAAMNKFNGTDE